MAKLLGFGDVEEVLAKTADLLDEMVLVGGQALNFWAERYLATTPELKAGAPYTSKDIDFSAAPRVVVEVAKRLCGQATTATIDDLVNTGLVTFRDSDGDLHEIDFIGDPYGIEPGDLQKWRLEMALATERGAIRFRVMDPVLILESRCANVACLPGYQSRHALNQCRAAIVCAREFVREILSEVGPKEARRVNERVFKLLFFRKSPREVYRKHGIDPVKSILVDSRLGENFLGIRYPTMLEQISKRWKRHDLP